MLMEPYPREHGALDSRHAFLSMRKAHCIVNSRSLAFVYFTTFVSSWMQESIPQSLINSGWTETEVLGLAKFLTIGLVLSSASESQTDGWQERKHRNNSKTSNKKNNRRKEGSRKADTKE